MKIKNKHSESKLKIKKIEITKDKLSGRGGLVFILRYLENINLYKLLEQYLSVARRNKKGKTIFCLIKQILAYFIEGSYHGVSGFDKLRNDDGRAAVLEMKKQDLIGTDIVKRFFRKFIGSLYTIFRPVLHELFVWRLLIEKPEVIVLDIDTMVMDNDDALKREGVNPTYKNKKGFQNLQVSWKSYIIDGLFRSGEKHSNHGDDVVKILKKITGIIRKRYKADIPILVTMDSGFMSEKNFLYLEDVLKIHFICAGKLYDDILQTVGKVPASNFEHYDGRHNVWAYYEFGNKLKSWQKYRRAIYTTLVCEDNQLCLEFARPDSMIYTNLGQDSVLDNKLIQAGYGEYLKSSKIIEIFHQRGTSELNHRSFKEFMGSEHLSFKRFGMNGAYYYLMVIAHFLFESYKYDVSGDVIPITSYPTKFRRELIDFAVKIVKTGGEIILKVTQAIWDRINVILLWERCNHPIPILI